MRLSRLLLVVLLIVPVFAGAQRCGETARCDDTTAWMQPFNAFDLKAAQAGAPVTMRWQARYEFNGGDLWIDVEQAEGGVTKKGTLVLLAGRALLAQGLALEPEYAIDALDGPVLMWKLATTLLTRALPEGPAALAGSRELKLTEGERAVRVNTQSAAGEFGLPWELTGTVSKVSAAEVRFDLRFLAPGMDGALLLAGSLARRPPAPVVPDALPLANWQVFALGPRSEQRDGVTIIDYGTTADSKPYATVGEMRAAIAAAEKAPAAK